MRCGKTEEVIRAEGGGGGDVKRSVRERDEGRCRERWEG